MFLLSKNLKFSRFSHSRRLASYWSQVEYILVVWHAIGYRWSIFSVHGILLFQKQSLFSAADTLIILWLHDILRSQIELLIIIITMKSSHLSDILSTAAGNSWKRTEWCSAFSCLLFLTGSSSNALDGHIVWTYGQKRFYLQPITTVATQDQTYA